MKYRRNGVINDIKHVLCRRTERYIQARVVGACFVTSSGGGRGGGLGALAPPIVTKGGGGGGGGG